MTMKILVPIDLADMQTMGKVLQAAVQQAEAAKAELTVMTVVPDMLTGIDWRYAIRGETGGSQEYDLREIVEEALERLPQGAACTVAAYTDAGKPFHVISKVVMRINAWMAYLTSK